MIDRDKLKALIRDVIKDLLEKERYQKSVLCIFSGSVLGFDDSISSIKKLVDEGYIITALVTKNAQKTLDMSKIYDVTKRENVILDDFDIYGLCDENSILILPTLSTNSAAKIASCIADNCLTNAVSYMIIKKKPIVATFDGCCPLNKKRVELYGDIRVNYSKKMTENIATIMGYGITMTDASKLYQKVVKISRNIDDDFNKDESTTDEKIVSAMTVKSLKSGTVLKVRKDAILTMSAIDVAKENSITIRKVN